MKSTFHIEPPFSSSEDVLELIPHPPLWTRRMLWLFAGGGLLCLLGRLAGYDPAPVLDLVPSRVTGRGWFWQIFTYAAVEPRPVSMLFNLLVLWLFGSPVEERLGGAAYVKLMALNTGLAGLLAVLSMPGSSVVVMAGQDGLALAVVGAFGMLFPMRMITVLLMLVFPVRMRAWVLASGMGALVLLFALQTSGASAWLRLATLPVTAAFLFGGAWWRAAAQRFPRRRRPLPEPSAAAGPGREWVRETVDPVLDKISREGLQSLTASEKKILEEARRVFEREKQSRSS